MPHALFVYSIGTMVEHSIIFPVSLLVMLSQSNAVIMAWLRELLWRSDFKMYRPFSTP